MIYAATLLFLTAACNWPIYRMIVADERRYAPRRFPTPTLIADVPYLTSFDPRHLT